jgi:hypothetical protein
MQLGPATSALAAPVALAALPPARELAHRAGDGLEVSLLWQPGSDALWVAVVDTREGDAFAVPVGDAPPLEVFRHPFAYAALRGTDDGRPRDPRRTASPTPHLASIPRSFT